MDENPGPPPRRSASRLTGGWASVLRILLTVAAVLVVAVPSLLFVFQRRLVYMPRHYEKHYRLMLPRGSEELRYATTDGAQLAFYIPPAADGETSATLRDPASATTPTLWVVFSGNASVALDWLDLVESFPAPAPAFLLVDYPGYGLCEGSPTRAGILRSSAGALAALAEHLHTPPDELQPRLGVMGHSIGAAAALEFATLHPPRRVLLVSPFTSLTAMARRAVGWPLCLLLRDRFDNEARLNQLAALPSPPRVDIVHGTADDIVPFAMGRALSAQHPSMITLHPVENADHNMIVMTAEHLMAKLMTAPEEAARE